MYAISNADNPAKAEKTAIKMELSFRLKQPQLANNQNANDIARAVIKAFADQQIQQHRF